MVSWWKGQPDRITILRRLYNEEITVEEADDRLRELIVREIVEADLTEAERRKLRELIEAG